MKLCYKCKKRPAVVFVQGMDQNGTQVGGAQGLCLVCAKESGIQPVNDMLSNMGISDEDIEAMSEQLMDFMGNDSLTEDDGEDDSFSPGGAATFPFMNGIFGNMDKAGKPDSSILNLKQIRRVIKRRLRNVSSFLSFVQILLLRHVTVSLM